MNVVPVIGIIGSAGVVGKVAVNTILKNTNAHVLLGGRNIDKITIAFPDLLERGDFFGVDINKTKQLDEFCSKCNIVVNCAGPAKKILDKVAFAALKAGAHYIDVAGDAFLYEMIKKNDLEIKEKKLSFIISAGLYPGFSEVFPSFIAKNFFDVIEKLEVFFACNGDLSFNAAYDFVCSIEEDYSKGMTFAKEGKSEKVKNTIFKKVNLPIINRDFNIYPVLTKDFESISRRFNIKEAYFYNTYENRSSLNSLIQIKMAEQYKTEAQKKKSAELMLKHNDPNKEKFTIFHIKAKGINNRAPAEKISTMYFNDDGNFVTGIVAGNAAKIIAEEKPVKHGCHYLYDAVDANLLMDFLSEQNVRPQ